MKTLVEDTLMPELNRMGLVLVEVQVPAEHRIKVFVDGHENVSIEHCTHLARFLRNETGEVLDPFEITLSSPGLDRPFRHPIQFAKNIGKTVEVTLMDGRKWIGKLESYNQNSLGIFPEIPPKHKAAKPKYEEVALQFPTSEIKQTIKHIRF
jgi:ribosome maturation factor RimP